MCRAIAGLANPTSNSTENATNLGAAGACQGVVIALKTHTFSTPLVEWACAAISALSDRHPNNQLIFYSMHKDNNMNVFKLLVDALTMHRTVPFVCYQSCRAVRSLSTLNTDNAILFAQYGIVPAAIKALRTHKSVEYVVEHSCWILATIAAPTTAPVEEEENEGEERLVDDSTTTTAATHNIHPTSTLTVDVTNTTTTATTTPVKTVSTSEQQPPVVQHGSPRLAPVNSIELYKDLANWYVHVYIIYTINTIGVYCMYVYNVGMHVLFFLRSTYSNIFMIV